MLVIIIHPRTVKEEQGLRPFQKATLQALKSPRRLLIVEAPVGSGKSYIIRRIIEDEKLSQRPLILTYPTKILMNAQINALKKEIGNISHWPDEPEATGTVTLFEYSTDSLIKYLRRHPDIARLDKSEIIHQILKNHQFKSQHNIIVTTPDVLHLIKKGAYKGKQRLGALLNGAIVVFDEFHLYTKLNNFAPLIKWLTEQIAEKIVFLSATPTSNTDLEDIWQKYLTERINFGDSVGTPSDRTFNYEVKLTVEECQYTKAEVMIDVLKKHIPILLKPTAIILDSVFRLRHLAPLIKREFGNQYKILEYSGMRKDNLIFDNKTVVLGTASVEVGVEMPIRSLIMESSYWTSAIQRFGRVARNYSGEAVILTRKRLTPYLKGRQDLTREELEQDILRRALKESVGTMVSGEMFRGDSYPFLLIDKKKSYVMPYSEALFAMFDIDSGFISNWRKLGKKQKCEHLQDYGIRGIMVDEVLLRDKIFPFWGVVSGKLKPEYENISVKLTDNELIIQNIATGKSYYFDY